VPVIRKFLAAGSHVIIAADGRPFEFLKNEFPQCRFIRFPGTPVRYPAKGTMTWQIFSQIPKMLWGTVKEHRFLKKVILEEKPDIVFSDNRYGLWNKSVYCIFMTHQLEIQITGGLKFLKSLFRNTIYLAITRYNECWIPDFELNWGLAGKLSHPAKLPPNSTYIGTLSRFLGNKPQYDPGYEKEYDIMAILSGPEPQRTIFENILLYGLEKSGLTAIVVSGRTEKKEEKTVAGKIRVFSYLETSQMKEMMMQSGMIICRPGYSGIMDLVSLGKRAILVPTPGQTEQEYLAKILLEKKIFFSLPQKNFDLIYALEMSINYPGMVLENDYKVLEERIKEIVTR
jgi:UDP-N-acetylglucosamine transferase subunit ALG13